MDAVTILDGSMGSELIARGVCESSGLWSAKALIEKPDAVRQLHLDYIRAGAHVITTNTYSTIPAYLQKKGLQHRTIELTELAGKIAREVAAQSPPTRVAGSLPPLSESYRADLVLDPQDSFSTYREMATTLLPYVDLFLCETMSCISEAVLALSCARTIAPIDMPCFVSFTLDEVPNHGLRSGEDVETAIRSVEELNPSAILFNCTSPSAIKTALVEAKQCTDLPLGAYPNQFIDVPEGWTLDGDIKIKYDDELTPSSFVIHVREFIDLGAQMVGGCCGIGPEYIRVLAESLVNREPRESASQND